MIDEKMIASINSKILKTDTCWLWQGAMSNKGRDPQYGTRRNNKNISIKVRRYLYETYVEKISGAKVAMPTCGNLKCVNPEHIKLETYSQKITKSTAPEKRKEQCASITHCPQGHEYAGYNLIRGHTSKKVVFKDGTSVVRTYPSRWCRTCMNQKSRESRARRAKLAKQIAS